jgi:hypothetical protein
LALSNTIRFSATAIGRGIEPLDARTDPEADITGVKRKKKKTFHFYLKKEKKTLAPPHHPLHFIFSNIIVKLLRPK